MTKHDLPFPFDKVPESGEKLGDLDFVDLMSPLLYQAHGLARICQHGLVAAAEERPDFTRHFHHALLLLSDILALACLTFDEWSKKESQRRQAARTNGGKPAA